MALERTEALVMRGVDFSQTSRVTTFLSPGRGVIACLAKGAKRPGSALSGQLDTFNRVEIVYSWRASRSVQALTECAIIESFPGIKRDLDKSTYAAFPLEFALKVARENEPSQELYGALVNGLRGLEHWEGDVSTHCSWQIFQLLSAAGFRPSLDTCCVCGAAVAEAAGFSYAGGVTCRACERDRAMDGETFGALRAMDAADRECPALAADAGCFNILTRFASRQVESEFRSVRVIGQVYGGAGVPASKSRG